MGQVVIKRYKHLLFSILFAVVLLFTAFAKITYPNEALTDFFLGVGVFEAVLALALIYYSTRIELWVVAALVFAVWAGYSLFWLIWGLPCECLGQMMELPPGASLVADIAFYGSAIYVLRLLGANLKQIHFLYLFSFFMTILGFLIGYGINRTIAN